VAVSAIGHRWPQVRQTGTRCQSFQVFSTLIMPQRRRHSSKLHPHKWTSQPNLQSSPCIPIPSAELLIHFNFRKATHPRCDPSSSLASGSLSPTPSTRSHTPTTTLLPPARHLESKGYPGVSYHDQLHQGGTAAAGGGLSLREKFLGTSKASSPGPSALEPFCE
jgi:hypothetical protein